MKRALAVLLLVTGCDFFAGRVVEPPPPSCDHQRAAYVAPDSSWYFCSSD